MICTEFFDPKKCGFNLFWRTELPRARAQFGLSEYLTSHDAREQNQRECVCSNQMATSRLVVYTKSRQETWRHAECSVYELRLHGARFLKNAKLIFLCFEKFCKKIYSCRQLSVLPACKKPMRNILYFELCKNDKFLDLSRWTVSDLKFSDLTEFVIFV